MFYFQILQYCRIKRTDRHFGILYYAFINNSAGESFMSYRPPCPPNAPKSPLDVLYLSKCGGNASLDHSFRRHSGPQWGKRACCAYIQIYMLVKTPYKIVYIYSLIIITISFMVTVILRPWSPSAPPEAGKLDRSRKLSGQKTTGCPLEPVPANRKRGTCEHDR